MLSDSNVEIALLSESRAYNVEKGMRTLPEGIVEDKDDLVNQFRFSRYSVVDRFPANTCISLNNLFKSIYKHFLIGLDQG